MVMLGRSLFGSKDKVKRQQVYTPEQMQAMNQIFTALQGGGGAFGDMFGQFDPQQTADVFQKGVADPAMMNFRQRVAPGIQEMFADQGASSGLANSLASAGSDLQSGLNSQLEMFMNQSRMQNQQNRMGGLQAFMGAQPYQNYTQAGSPGLLGGAFSSLAGGLGKSFPWQNMFGGGQRMPGPAMGGNGMARGGY
jgi:hypothetical protein